MKYNKLFKTVCGIFATASLFTSCALDAPEIPVEELYLRGFIQQYGLIDPTQNFIEAEESSVTINLNGYAEDVNVYALVGDYYYRVAYYSQVSDVITIPVDVPKGTPELMVDVDGAVYYGKPGSTIDTKAKAAKVSSRAHSDDYVAQWISTTPSGIETVNLNASDGSMTGNAIAYVSGTPTIKTSNGAYIGPNASETATKQGDYAITNTKVGTNLHFFFNNQYATPATYMLNFKAISPRVSTINVSIIDQNGNYYLNQEVTLRKLSASLDITSDRAEDLEFITTLMPQGQYQMVITVVDAPVDPDGYESCGAFGYFSITKSQEVKDMAWIMACEDLGATDDFDFNDIVIRIEAVNLNNVAVEKLALRNWQYIDDNDQHINLHAPSRYAGDANVTQLTVTAMCAGGTLPLWLHYKENDGTDYIICPGKTGADAKVLAEGYDFHSALPFEWHQWFNEPSTSVMINTGIGYHREGQSATFNVTGYSMARFSFLDYDGTFDTITGDIEDVDDWDGLVERWKYFQDNANTCLNGFYITVHEPKLSDATASPLSAQPAGVPPQMFLIPDCSPTQRSGYHRHYGWEWPIEFVSIIKLYPGFKDWVNGKGPNYSTPSNSEGNGTMLQNAWFMNPVSGQIDSYDLLRYSRDPQHTTQNTVSLY